MLSSMTGYGRAHITRDGREILVELKTVNHRFLDIAFRMPRSFSFLEEDMRAQLSARLSRGHVDIFVTYRNQREDAREMRVDMPLLKAYLRSLDGMRRECGLEGEFSLRDAVALPDVLVSVERDDDQEALRALMRDAMGEALEALCAMREREGEALRVDLNGRLSALTEFARVAADRMPEYLVEYREKLRARIVELIGTQPDEARLLTEVALLADRAAVDEELTRLKSHIGQMRKVLSGGEPAGRKLDFLIQELGREVNTTGSKSQDIALTQAVLAAKAEIEKMREQVQNIE